MLIGLVFCFHFMVCLNFLVVRTAVESELDNIPKDSMYQSDVKTFNNTSNGKNYLTLGQY